MLGVHYEMCVMCVCVCVCVRACARTQDGHGTPILYAACEKGLDRILEKLLDKGADPNAREPVSSVYVCVCVLA